MAKAGERERETSTSTSARAREHRAPARVKDSADPGRDSNPATGPPSHIACTRDARLSDRLSSLSWSTSTPHQHEHQLLADEGSASTARPRPRRAAAELVPIHAREGQESESLRRWRSSLTLDLGVGGEKILSRGRSSTPVFAHASLGRRRQRGYQPRGSRDFLLARPLCPFLRFT